MVLKTYPDSKDIHNCLTSFVSLKPLIVLGHFLSFVFRPSPFYRGGLLFIVGLVSGSADRYSRLGRAYAGAQALRSHGAPSGAHSAASLGLGGPQGWGCVTVHLSW